MIKNPKIKNLPSSSGVYLFKNKKEIIYIGKAINIKKRVKDHQKDHYWLQVTRVDYQITFSELEALLLEANLIKQYQPKYNVLLKDDQRYLYLAFSKEKYPRLFLTRRPDRETKLLDWFGPFSSAQSIAQVLRLARKIFPYRSCLKLKKRGCLYYHLNLCPGPCLGKMTITGYRKNISRLRLFFQGKLKIIAGDLEKEMTRLAKIQNYEQAMIIKNQLVKLKALVGQNIRFSDDKMTAGRLKSLSRLITRYQSTKVVLPVRIEAYDVSNLGDRVIVGSMVIFINGEPQNRSYRRFKIKTKSGGDPAGIKEIITRRLKHHEWLSPQLILVDGGKAQVASAFMALGDRQIALLGLAKREEQIIIPIINQFQIVGWKVIKYSARNEALKLLQSVRDEAHRFAQRYYKKRHHRITFFSPKQISTVQNSVKTVNKPQVR